MHTIIHIGAGQASELPQWLETGAKQIVLVEPNPELAEQLRQRTAQHPQVTVVEAAITTEPANNQLREYNLPEATSLHPATGLKELFPGLQQRSVREVETQHPAELVKQSRPEPQPGDELSIISPGEEHHILQALAESGLLTTFTRLSLLAHEEPLYENAQSYRATVDWLQTQGFELKQTNAEDPDWPVWELVRNPLQDKVDAQAQTIEQLRQKTSKSEQSQSEAQERQKALEAELEQLRSTLAAQQEQQANAKSALQEKQQQLEQSEQGRKQAQDALASQREAARKANDDNQRVQQRLEELKAEAKQATKAVSQAEQARSEAEAENKALVAELQQVKGWLTERKEQVAKAEADLHEKQKEIDALRKQLNQAKNAEAEATKANTETSESLEDFKKRFQSRKKQAEELQAQLEQLQSDTSATSALEDKVAELAREKDAMQQKNQLLQQDLVKAEAQLQMIKEFVLHD